MHDETARLWIPFNFQNLGFDPINPARLPIFGKILNDILAQLPIFILRIFLLEFWCIEHGNLILFVWQISANKLSSLMPWGDI